MMNLKISKKHFLALAVAAAVGVMGSFGPAHASAAPTTHTLTSTGSNSWSTATWTNSAPSGSVPGDIASYSTATSASNTTLNVTGIGLGQLDVTGSGTWTLSNGTGTSITLDNTGGNANPFADTTKYSFIGTTSSGGIAVNPGVVIANTNLTVGSTGTGPVTLNGGITGTGNLFVADSSTALITIQTAAINNAGTLTFGNSDATTVRTGTGTITVSGGIGSSVGNIVDNAKGNLVISGSSVANTGSITFSGVSATTVTFSSTTINNAGLITNNGATSGATTISGALGSAVTGVTENSGTSALTLSGDNTNFDGKTTLTAGTLNLDTATVLGGNGSSSGTGGTFTIFGGTLNTVAGGITISTVNAENWNGSFTFTGTGNLNLGTGAVTLGATDTVTVSANTLTVNGAIGGSTFGITKAGAGTLLLGALNTYTGTTTVNAGVLQSAVSASSGTPLGTGAITLNGGTLNLLPTGSGSDVTFTGGTAASGTLFTFTGNNNTLILAKGAENSLTYTFGGGGAALARGTNGTLVVTQDGSLGSATGVRFILNGTAPAMNGTNANLVNLPIVVQNSPNDPTGDFLAYGVNGFISSSTEAAYTVPSSTAQATVTGAVWDVTGNSIAGANSTAASLAAVRVAMGQILTIAPNTTLSVGSTGNLAQFILNGGAITGGLNSTLALGAAEGTIYVSSAGGTLGTSVSGTGQLTLFGPGMLIIANNNTTAPLNIANNIVNNASGLAFSGNGTINLNYGNASSLGYGLSTAGITINSGTTVSIANQFNNSNPFGGNNPTITDNGNLIFAESGSPTVVQQLATRIIGTGSVTMNTGAALVMKVLNSGGADNFSGGLNIISGTWRSTFYATAFGTGVVSFFSPNAVLDVTYGNGNANFGETTGGLSSTGTLGSVTAGGANTGGFSTLTLTALAATNSQSFGGAITNGAGGMAITLTSGTQIFTGSSSYTKGTTVSGGTLVATGGTSIGGATGALTVGAAGTFNYAPTAATPSALTVATLSLTSGGKIGAGIGDTTTDGGIVVTGAASGTGAASSATKINIEGDPFIASAPNGTYTLVTAASGLLNGSNYTLGTVYNATNFTVTGAPTGVGGTSITVGIASQTALTTEYWKGGFSGGAGVWAASDGSTASNWTTDLGGATPTSLTPGSAATVVFSASGASGQSTMTLGANMTVAGIVVNDTTAQTLTDGYTLTVGTGGITVNSGAGAVNYNVPVALNGAQTWLNNSSSTLTVSGPIYNGANTLTIDGTGNTVISGNLGVGAAATPGTGGLTVVGSGTVTLFGANSYTGATAIQNGTLVLGTVSGSTTTLGSIASSSGVTLGNGTTSGILQIGDANNANNATLLSLVTAGTGAANAVVGGNANNSLLTLNIASGTDTYAGVLGGAGTNQNNLSLAKSGAGTLALTSVNTYAGGTVISAGTLNITGAGTLGATAGSLVLSGASTLDLGATSQTVGAVNLTAATGTVLIRNGNLTAASVTSSNASGTNTISAVLQGNATVTNSGAGTLLLSGPNTYTGTTTINAGTLFAGIASVANTSGAFGNNSAVTLANVAGATLNITGFSTQIGSLTGGGATGGNVTLGAATLTTGGDNISPAAYAGIISGTGGLTKIGTGTAILTGANTYSGATSVNAGTLTLNRTSGAVLANSAVSVGTSTTNATLQITGNNTIGTAAGGSLTLAGGDGVTTGRGTLSLVDGSINTFTLTNRTTPGINFTVGSASGPAILNFEIGASAGVNDSVALGNDSLSVASGGGIINITPLSTIAAGSYNLITYASKTGTGIFTFDGTNTSEVIGSLTLSLVSGPSAEVLSITTASVPTAYFQGATDANWSTNIGGVVNFTSDFGGNFNLGALPGSQTNVHFSATNATQTAGVVVSNLDASFTINSLKFDNGTAGATINAGGGTLTINAGNFNGSSAGDGISIAAGAGPVTIAAPIILGAGQTWTNNSSNQFVVSGSISGANSLTTVGSIQLSGINSYSGGTIVSSGTLQLNGNSGAGGNGGLGNINNALTVNGTLDLNATSQGIGSLTGTGTILNSSGATVSTLTIGNNNATGANFNGVLEDNAGAGGTLALLKVGTGTATLAGPNTYTGGTTLSAGGLSGTTVSLQGNIAAANATTITFIDSINETFSGTITGGNSAAVTINASATVDFTTANNYTGGTTLAAGTLELGNSEAIGSSGTITFSGGTLQFSSANNTDYSARFAVTAQPMKIDTNGQAVTLASALMGSTAGSLTVSDTAGGGSLTLNHLNSFTGLTEVKSGANLILAGSTANNSYTIQNLQVDSGGTATIGNSTQFQVNRTANTVDNGTIDLNGNFEFFNIVTGSGVITDSSLSQATVGIARGGGSNAIAFTALIQDGTGQVSVDPQNNTILTAANTYTGTTNVQGGTLSAGIASAAGSGAFGNNSAVTLAGGNLSLTNPINSTSYNTAIGSLAGTSGTLSLGSATLTIGGDNTSTAFGGTATITGAGNIVKVGSGTLTLSGANSYTGTTTLSAGTLLVQSTNASSALTLNGGILGGYGAISGLVSAGSGPHTIAPSATLSPTATGTLTLGGLTTALNTTLQFNLVTPTNSLLATTSNSDTLMVTGANGLTLNGGTINLANHATGPASLGFYKVIAYSGAIGGTGLSSLTLPATVANVEYTFDTTHDAGFVDIHRGFAGDVDDSGFVDINDLAILAAHWQQTGGWAQGNFLNDPLVDINDLAILAANWQTGITSFGEAADSLDGTSESFQQAVAGIVFGGASSVPEPTSLALLGMGAAGLILRRRRAGSRGAFQRL